MNMTERHPEAFVDYRDFYRGRKVLEQRKLGSFPPRRGHEPFYFAAYGAGRIRLEEQRKPPEPIEMAAVGGLEFAQHDDRHQRMALANDLEA